MRPVDIGQWMLWNLGWLLLMLVWLGPLPHHVMRSFAAHMSVHMAVVAVAAPLLSLGLAGRKYDPVDAHPALFSPLLASLGELAIVWLWHAPRPHHWACFTAVGFAAEQLSFLAAGLWIWLAAIGGHSPRSRQRSAAGVIALLVTSMHMTLLGALLALAQRPLYPHGPPGDAIRQLQDQQLGGAIMLVVGGASFLLGGLALTYDLLRPVPSPSEVFHEASPNNT